MTLDPKKEFEGLGRTHDLDKPKFIAWVKKMIKDKTIRVDRYLISPLIDGKMLKIEVEGFYSNTKANRDAKMVGTSKGLRIVKGYLSETVCDDLVALLDAIPKKMRQDMRTKSMVKYPKKVLQIRRSADKDLDLDNLFD